MQAYDKDLHFRRDAKEVTFLLGGAAYPQRATLAVMQRVEDAFGPAAVLAARLMRGEYTVRDLSRLMFLILRDHPGVPQGAAMLAALEAIGVTETASAAGLWITYGLSSDMPQEPQAGN
jgi:hypothetical protein